MSERKILILIMVAFTLVIAVILSETWLKEVEP